MKKFKLSIIGLCIALTANAQFSKTVNINEGELNSVLTTTEKKTITHLTITGIIDARDFAIMRDSMSVLDTIDITGVSIAYYSGAGGTLSTGNYAANTIPQNSFYKEGSINGKGTFKCIHLPSSITAIGQFAFFRCQSIISISMPAQVATFGNSAFSQCSNLASINIDPVNPYYTSIEGVIFNKDISSLIICPGGKSGIYTIPSTVTNISGYSFYNCGKINSIIFPESLTSIGDYSFSDCYGLTTLSFPNTLQTIGRFAFQYCSNLNSVSIPASVLSINDGAFTICIRLVSISVDASNPSFSSLDGVLFNKDFTILLQCPGGKPGSYIIPSSVTSISFTAFRYCINLTSVVIPHTVTTIEPATFSNCYSLTSVFIPSSVTKIKNAAFQYCNKLSSVRIPSTMALIEAAAFAGCTSLSSIYANPGTPINLNSSANVFFSVNKNTCILYVPVGSKSLYQAANQWQDFVNIIEEVPMVINDNIDIQLTRVYMQNEQIIIKGEIAGKLITIYNLQGKVLFKQKANSNEIRIKPSFDKLYLIKVGSENFKIVRSKRY